MGRGKVQLKRIEKTTNRQVTFCKRRNGLMKKASELSVLCDAEVALVVFSGSGKLYEFGSNSMKRTIDRYKKIQSQKLQQNGHLIESDVQDMQYWQEEARKLKEQHEAVNNSIRHLMGETITSLSMGDLDQLEAMLERSIGRVRSKKDQSLVEECENRQRREYALRVENQLLYSKVVEREGCGSTAEMRSFLPTDFQFLRVQNSNSNAMQTTLQL